MKPQSKADKIKQVLMADATTSVDKIAKRFKVAPSYVYNIRKKLRGEFVNELSNEPFTPEEEEALDRLLTNEGWTVSTSSEDGQMIAMQTSNALNVQVGGDHYKKLKIQPIEFIHANNIPFIEGNIIKYIVRWRDKNGIKDLEKVKHYVDLLISLEKL
jgi:hypothetical protein